MSPLVLAFDRAHDFLKYRLMNVEKIIGSLTCAVALFASALVGRAQVNQVTNIAPDVYFHEGDIKDHGHCNNGWIVFEDYVLVIDGNFPSGAQEIIPKIKAITDKPIRFVFDTHHHGDHAYGNQVWQENGATAVAHIGVIEEMKKYEIGYYGSSSAATTNLGRWEKSAKERPDVAASKLKPPSLLYDKKMIFDDGKHRVELLHFGVAHTHGDGFAWLPKEKILFTGDACVNGPYNYAADGDTGAWIKTLEAAKRLGAKIICPGHGPIGPGEVLEDQQNYFLELRKQVRKHSREKPEEVKAEMDEIKTALQKKKAIVRYIGDSLPAQVEKVFVELGGKPFPTKETALDEHQQHARSSGQGLHLEPF